VHESDANRFLAQRRHVERHAQGLLEAVAMREHRARARRRRVEARVVRGLSLAEVTADDEHAIESLDLEAHFELELAVLVALLRGLACFQDAADRLQHVRRDGLGPQRIDGLTRDLVLGARESAHGIAADAGENDAVPAHDEREVGQRSGDVVFECHAVLSVPRAGREAN
jgi:hypothetical protein